MEDNNKKQSCFPFKCTHISYKQEAVLDRKKKKNSQTDQYLVILSSKTYVVNSTRYFFQCDVNWPFAKNKTN